MGAIDIAVILTYLAGITFLGIWFSGRQKSIDEFFKAKRGLSWLPLGISLMAALNSGIDYLTQPGAVMRYGFILVVVPSVLWIVQYFYVTRVCIPFYTRLNIFSAYEYLEKRFDGRIRTLAAIIFILWRLCWMGAALYVPCLAINSVSHGDIPLVGTVVVIGVTVTIFCMLGGFRAVVWTQVLQFGIMFTGLAITVAVIMSHLSGDWGGVLATAAEEGRLWFIATPPEVAPNGLWEHITTFFKTDITMTAMICGALVGRMTAYTADQIMVQRLAASRSAHEAKKSFIINAVSDSTWMLVLGFIGLALFAYAKKTGFGEGLPRDKVFPAFIGEFFPIGLKGLVVSALMAASLSCVSGAINSCAATVITDMYNRGPRRNRAADLSENSQKQEVRISRIVTLVLGLAATILAANVGRLGELFEIMCRVIALFVGPIFGLFVLGMFTRTANALGVLIGGIVSQIVTIYVVFYARDLVSFLWTETLGLSIMLTVGYVASLLIGSNGDSNLNWTFRQVMAKREIP